MPASIHSLSRSYDRKGHSSSKGAIGGQEYPTIDLLREAINRKITYKNANGKYLAVQKLPERWNKCVENKKLPLTYMQKSLFMPKNFKTNSILKFAIFACNNRVYTYYVCNILYSYFNTWIIEATVTTVYDSRSFCIF